MRAVDTHVPLRLLARGDAKQAAAADAAVAKGAWVSHLVLAETVWVLDAVYERTPMQLIAALNLLLAHEALVLQDADVVAAALAQFRAKPALGFSDCLVLEIARKAGNLPLVTFDKSLGRLQGPARIAAAQPTAKSALLGHCIALAVCRYLSTYCYFWSQLAFVRDRQGTIAP